MDSGEIRINLEYIKSYIVYCLYRHKICIYVGMSTKGANRPFANGGKWQIATELVIYPCESEKQAIDLEKEFIEKLNPFLNIAHRIDKVTSFCEVCDRKLVGRTDKRFCSNGCRVKYHRAVGIAKKLKFIE